MKSHEIRSVFVDYFQRNAHTQVKSSSLIPENDPTLLFANAGMNQFKNAFLGIERRDYTKAVSVQKCVRAGGKHNDLDNVGFTARHHTFFEMLGNFSFGDYFKKDAIHYAWELLTKEFGIPKEKLYVTVFETDDEAADIWHKQEGLPKDRIFRLGEKDNFWRMGDTGPCGPCSEIFFDHGPSAGRESDPYKGIIAGEDRFIEIWNLVFMQFYEKAPGVMDPLPKPSVDTGAGLERVVAAIQGNFNNYNTDLFAPLIAKACKVTGADYVIDPNVLAQFPEIRERTAALRVMADHCRSTGFLIADGAMPANDGRGYVLRRIIRRALRFGRKLNATQSILPSMIESLIESMGDIYPELRSRRDIILSTVKDEEQRFSATLDQGTEMFNQEFLRAHSLGQSIIPGETVFKLYDTYGFPVDLTKLMAEEKGMSIDEKGFETQMNQARIKAKTSWKGQALASDEVHFLTMSQELYEQHKGTQFVGYETMETSARVLGLSNGKAHVNCLVAGESGFVILDKTSFYAEGGGQVGDQGELTNALGGVIGKTGEPFKATVHGCTRRDKIYFHAVTVEQGELRTGEVLLAKVSYSARRNTESNHSATHLMHAALRSVLGDHVTQAGSSVDPDRLRFDFTHNKALSFEEIQKIESSVNEQIAQSVDVASQVMSMKEAVAAGAMALFGEKYGDEVRVINMGKFSCELCGGTHVRNTSQIRMFKIISEGGVSSGIRRIEAITGEHAITYALTSISELGKARASAGLAPVDEKPLESWIEEKKSEIKNLEREIKKLQGAQVSVSDLVQSAIRFGKDSKLVFGDLPIEDREVLAKISDEAKNKIQSGIVVLVGTGGGAHPVNVCVTKDLLDSFKAGDLLKEIAGMMGGKGGGRPDFAQGAAPDRSKLSEVRNSLQQRLKAL
ncbi:MAG: alanine--tRNA ligase [Bdellovibrionaceae bacterium]|nr:alanine--tRNA ligase [Pseudobdellovibrionaceae bacterium]